MTAQRLKGFYEDWGVALLLFLAIIGCFVAMAFTPDRPVYPDLLLPSRDLVRLEADYTKGTEITYRGRLVGRAAGQLLLRNQAGDLVYIPYSKNTQLLGLPGSSPDKLELGQTLAVTRPAGAAPASSIRGLD